MDDLSAICKANEICNQYGVLLIFAEVMTGFRIAPGRAQEYFNKPDKDAVSLNIFTNHYHLFLEDSDGRMSGYSMMTMWSFASDRKP